MKADFNNKNVLITSSSRGIGKPCATLFAESGANVIITYKINQKEAEKTIVSLKGAKFRFFKLDIADRSILQGFSAKMPETGCLGKCFF